MKFKFKTLLAAVALATSAASANAAIELGSTTGGSELVFSAWDNNTSTGYTFDILTALKLESFIGADTAFTANQQMLDNATISNSLITGPNGQILDVALTGFPFTSSVANVEWNFAAVDNISRNRLITTKDSNDASPVAATNVGVNAAVTVYNSYFSQASSLAANQGNNDVDGFNTSILADGPAYAGNFGNNFAGNLWDTTNAMGDSSFVYLAARGIQASSGGAQQALFKQLATANGENLVASTYQQGGQWRLNLSVAAIPEPETYAMFLAGLGMMGAVARRRKGQVK
jgi:hypothetical protein